MIESAEMLLAEQIREIEDRAEQVLSDVFGTPDPPIPVDLNQVVTKLGLVIKQGRFKNPDIVGYYDRAAKTIYVSEIAPYSRQAFTIAHEIGHSIMHEDLPKETFFRHAEMSLSTEDKLGEQEANWFAASLLMPRKLVESYWREFPGNLARLTALFNVSQTAMQYRVKNLSLSQD